MTREFTNIILLYKKIGVLQAKFVWLECEYLNRETNKFSKLNSLINKTQFIIFKKINQLKCMFDNDQVNELVKYGEEQQLESKLNEEIAIEEKNRPLSVMLDPDAIINATEIEIPFDVKLVFSWGQKFLFPYFLTVKNMPLFLAQIEDTISQLVPVAMIEHTTVQVKKVIENQRIDIFDHNKHWLMFIKRRTENFLNLHKDIKPISSDKGKTVIIMYLQDYYNKMEQHLDNSEHYDLCNFNPIQALSRAECDIIRELRKNDMVKHFTKAYEDKCMTLPKMYGIIKTHKENKIRPITSNAGKTVGAQLNNILNELLTRIFPIKDRHILNSSQMKEFIDNIILPDNHILVSFDAVSMFTNIPTRVIINIVGSKLREFRDIFRLEGKLVMKMFNFILNECVYFTALGRIYKQKSGLPMGGSISPICCRLVMDQVMESITIEPFFIKVYVDDTLVALNKQDIEPMLKQLNEYHENIQFTVEVEQNACINFLNMTIIRNDQRMMSRWYKKPYASYRLLNYFSAHKRTVIINTAIQFIKTVLELSDASFFGENKEMIIQTLQKNCFPEIEIMKLIHNYSLMVPLHNTEIDNDRRFVSIPFCNTNYNGIAKVIVENMIIKLKPADSIRNVKINLIRNIKDATPIEQMSNMIVKMICCCKSKTKIQMTKFNQQTSELIKEMKSKSDKFECDQVRHIFVDFEIIKGLATISQTRCYLKYLHFKHFETMYDKLNCSLPNKHFSKLL